MVLGQVRAFWAIDVPESSRLNIARWIDLHKGTKGLKLVPAANVHLTLKFLGQVSEDTLGRLIGAASLLARSQMPFAVTLGGLGAYPDERKPRILWMGVGEGAGPMAALAAALDAAAGKEGLPQETRPFSAHLTLARLAHDGCAADLKRLLEGPPPEPFSFLAGELVLYRSDTGGAASVYTALNRIPLAN